VGKEILWAFPEEWVWMDLQVLDGSPSFSFTKVCLCVYVLKSSTIFVLVLLFRRKMENPVFTTSALDICFVFSQNMKTSIRDSSP
jgi:hypothetical protein